MTKSMKAVLWRRAARLQDKILAAAKLAELTGNWEPWKRSWKQYETTVAKAKRAT
jgi:hypothetical protein